MAAVFSGLGPYEILQEIGRGGMAVVFLARDTRSDRHVALKLVPQGSDREAREILEAEQWGAELQKQFCQISPHVPAVYEHGIESGYFYVAMEYLDGENLSDVISRGALSVDRAVGTAIGLCRFLEDAHRFEATIGARQLRFLLHGDLKPRNIRITAAGQVKVLDFGIAKALSLSRKVTRNDFGSIAYLSPERLESGEVDGYADFWAVGVLLHEMLTGSPPFQAPDTRRLEQLIMARRAAPILDPSCPTPARAVVAKLLAPDPTARYDSATAIREDLERVASGGPTVAEREGWPARAEDESPTRRTRPARDAADEATRRTSPPAAAPPLPPPPPFVIPPIPVEAARPTPVAVPPVPQANAAPRASATPQASATPKADTSKPRRRWPRRFLIAALVFAGLRIIGNEMDIARAAERATAAVSTRELGQLSAAWNQYDALTRRSFFRGTASELGAALSAHTLVLANDVFDDFRSPTPSVREAQWLAVRDALARALAVSPSSRLRAALRYADGHLHRINGEARKLRRQAAAQQDFISAVKAFREAAELKPGWPDPFLGLARTFIYGLDDVDRGADAFEQARRAGHTPIEREDAQLGDGFRARGEALRRSARDVVGMPQEREYLTRAADAYRQAIEHYTKAGDVSNAPKNLGLANRQLTHVQQRLGELTAPAGQEQASLNPEGGGDQSGPKRVPETR